MIIHRRSALTWLAASGFAVAALTTSLLARPLHNQVCCPDCGNKVCVPTPTVNKTKKIAYSCDCKDICIPGIKGPFATCCEAPRCGRSRTIKVLMKVEYECPKCGYKWDVKSANCNCCN